MRVRFLFIFRSLEADIDLQHEINDQALQNINLSLHSTEENSRSPKRKKLRSNGGSKSYDFREYGVDARRRGAKHQRRKQNCMSIFAFSFLDKIILLQHPRELIRVQIKTDKATPKFSQLISHIFLSWQLIYVGAIGRLTDVTVTVVF